MEVQCTNKDNISIHKDVVVKYSDTTIGNIEDYALKYINQKLLFEMNLQRAKVRNNVESKEKLEINQEENKEKDNVENIEEVVEKTEIEQEENLNFIEKNQVVQY